MRGPSTKGRLCSVLSWSALRETDRGAALWLRERSACGGGDDAQAMAYAFEAPPRGSRRPEHERGHHAARRPQAGRQMSHHRCIS
eukprot:COSAG01_NODE_2305_length_7947_cov_76.250127_11_plen_85_part_00